MNTMNNKQRLEYALRFKRLYDLFVIKENIAFTHLNQHYNKSSKKLDILQDKILHDTIQSQIEGNVDVSITKNSVDDIIDTALKGYSKTILKTNNKFYNHAVEKNIETYSNILYNRINRQNVSLQAKIEDELRKSKYNNLSEAKARVEVTKKFKDEYRKGAKNVIRDALHTNEANLSFINAVENGMKYKVWHNGRSHSHVRVWHRARYILPVEIDDYFDIYGSYHAQLMYPGDLNGGAENIANCRCWLSYTNTTPSTFKKKTSTTIKVSNRNINRSISHKIQSVRTKIKNRINKIKKTFKNLSNNNWRFDNI